jgi:hypothetical protein
MFGAMLAPLASADGTDVLGSDLSAFAVLAGSTVTNTDATTITGDVGVYAGSAITGEGSITLTGAYEIANGVASGAQTGLSAALIELAGYGPGTTQSSSELGTLTLLPGTYTVPGAALLDGTLTLNGNGNANATWVFLVDGLTTGTGSKVVVENTGAGAGIYFVDSSSTTLGVGTSFEGNILASTSITLDTGATDNCGRALASTGAVTLDNNTISIGCTAGYGSGTNGFSGGTGSTAVPEPGTWELLLAGALSILCLSGLRRHKHNSRSLDFC